jgi:hypothetical protein
MPQTIPFNKPFPSEEMGESYQSLVNEFLDEVRFTKINLPAFDRGACTLIDTEDNVLVIASCHEHIVFHVANEKQVQELIRLQETLRDLVVNQLKAIDKHFAAKKERVRSKCEKYKDQYTLKVQGKYLFLSVSADSIGYNLSFKELDIKEESGFRRELIVLHGGLYPRAVKEASLRMEKYGASVQNAHFKLHSMLSEITRFVSAMKHKFNIQSLEK